MTGVGKRKGLVKKRMEVKNQWEMKAKFTPKPPFQQLLVYLEDSYAIMVLCCHETLALVKQYIFNKTKEKPDY